MRDLICDVINYCVSSFAIKNVSQMERLHQVHYVTHITQTRLIYNN